jgi:hypothetical protein
MGISPANQETRQDSKSLLTIATPALYQKNAFRLLKLAVNATKHDIIREEQKIEMIQKLGDSNGQVTSPFPFNITADPHTLADTTQRLLHADQRLIDEFFWFWPIENGNGKNDQALQAIRNGDIEKAKSIWSYNSKNGNEYISIHNLAILNHMIALDYENMALTARLSENQMSERDHSWSESIWCWSKLLEREAIWSRLSDRIREFNHPGLNTGESRRIKTSLPEALVFINAQLALAAAERGDTKEVKRQLGLMNKFGFGKDVIENALNRAVSPLRSRILVLCRNARDEIEKDVEKTAEAGLRLLDQAQPLLGILDMLLSESNYIRQNSRDEVALACFNCVIYYGNKTSKWEVPAQVLARLLNIAVTDSAKTQIQENLDIANRNIEFYRIHGKCWYCKQEEANEKCTVGIGMHGNVTREYYGSQTLTRWNKQTVNVPRCRKCANNYSMILTMLIIFTVIIFIIGCSGLGVCIALAIMSGIGAIVYGSIMDGKTKSFPVIRENVKEGWGFGLKPPGVN